MKNATAALALLQALALLAAGSASATPAPGGSADRPGVGGTDATRPVPGGQSGGTDDIRSRIRPNADRPQVNPAIDQPEPTKLPPAPPPVPVADGDPTLGTGPEDIIVILDLSGSSPFFNDALNRTYPHSRVAEFRRVAATKAAAVIDRIVAPSQITFRSFGDQFTLPRGLPRPIAVDPARKSEAAGALRQFVLDLEHSEIDPAASQGSPVIQAVLGTANLARRRRVILLSDGEDNGRRVNINNYREPGLVNLASWGHERCVEIDVVGLSSDEDNQDGLAVAWRAFAEYLGCGFTYATLCPQGERLVDSGANRACRR